MHFLNCYLPRSSEKNNWKCGTFSQKNEISLNSEITFSLIYFLIRNQSISKWQTNIKH